jgi:hypothetical protein
VNEDQCWLLRIQGPSAGKIGHVVLFACNHIGRFPWSTPLTAVLAEQRFDMQPSMLDAACQLPAVPLITITVQWFYQLKSLSSCIML